MVAAEDTRVTKALLAHFGIGARVIALHEHNERAAAEGIVALLREGKSVALASDAGTPAVSDPGALLVERVRAEGFPVVPIPGASALTAALSASGIAADGVVFAGFLPSKGARAQAPPRRSSPRARGPSRSSSRRTASRRRSPTCTPRWASATSSSAASSPSASRPSRACRSREAVDWVKADANRSRGEFVLVVEGRPVEASTAVDPKRVLEVLLARAFRQAGLRRSPRRSPASIAASSTGWRSR